jgi:4-carboxymuconolactone decarboxylase
LTRQQRSLLNLAMLTALGKPHELGVHVRGAIRNGCSLKEIQETLLHASVYAGLPAGLEAFRAAEATLKDMVEKNELKARL